MKKLILIALVMLPLAACSTTEKTAAVGAASGAIVGGLVSGNVRGAAVGALAGGATGAVVGAVSDRPGQCTYRDRFGRQHVQRC